ncbi:midasin [Culicoides brevitarsis]|uniref:midasin n=1 Tax=Culicoides brevitarsis TaxID=469753 RepID=UPI00307CB5D3
MDIKIVDFHGKYQKLLGYIEDSQLASELKQETHKNVLENLTKCLLNPDLTETTARLFPEIVVILFAEIFSTTESDANSYKQKVIALAKLIDSHSMLKSLAYNHFKASPLIFWEKNTDKARPAKQRRVTSQVPPPSDAEIVKAAYYLLKSDPNLFKQLWKWSDFLDLYWNKGDDVQKFFCNKIIGILTAAEQARVSKLHKMSNISEEVLLFEGKSCKTINFDYQVSSTTTEDLTVTVQNSDYINVEGVFLPIYDKNLATVPSDVQMVGSTRTNLRSLAVAVASNKPACLNGPVGCGKTMLVDYLAKVTGRAATFIENDENSTDTQHEGTKRKRQDSDTVEASSPDPPVNAMLRIQLGDQTDSKTLLGQYRCTDVPGEFVWQPGVLTQAVMHGSWLLLEDLNAATQDVCTVLTGLLENNFLSVPGFRNNLRIEPGFQLFLTMRSGSSASASKQYQPYTLLEKYLYTIHLLPLSRDELCEIVSKRFTKLATVANRIVDIFLTFSSGRHTTNDENDTTDDSYEALPHTSSVSIEEVSRSGRLLSTRDLFKLCKRSEPSFSVSSTECAYFVFQNAVDIFCCHLAQGKLRTALCVEIGSKLGIIQSRCEYLADENKPEVEITDETISVGRAKLSRLLPVVSKKRAKLEALQTSDAPIFSFTRIAACILERIAICVEQNEPVLLIGETGVGKTSSVQFLAHKMSRKLVVVNMNNQSDVSDLIGGYKPVDLKYIIAPLRAEFEGVFRETFNVEKNQKFLQNISICFNSGDFSILVKLMLKIIDPAMKKCEGDQQLLIHWKQLRTKLTKLNKQLTEKANISFAFIPGSLVNCIKNGDWILLDEINLASSETLECLSTILEPNGSVILLEKGDFKPVSRSKHFRIFACMNPSTDVGKKDLPQGIRNRFTEFFVDELTSERDLTILVSDYLLKTGMQPSRIHAAVKLYRKLRQLAQLDLNDGLGNRPTYSLRTLCRALNISAKNLCGSVERNLYESFCLSFLTQVDAISHDQVLKLIQGALVSDVKAVLSYKIPKPKDGDYINFEGYWIEKGTNEVLECADYILTESVKKNLKDLARIISIGKLPILLQGPTSAGKTSLISYIAKKSGNTCVRINNHEHTDIQEYVGTYVADVSGRLVFMEGVLVQAMRNGYWIILDELNLASSDILEALNRVLDDNRELYIPETQTVVKAHPNFMLFATQNPPGLYGGRKTLSRAFKNRFVELHFIDIPRPELEIILEKRCLIPASYAKKMVKTMSELQMNRQTTAKSMFTLRDLFRWGNRYTFANKKLMDDKNYDWNQHLIDEGYLVLSSRIRTDYETEIIGQALYANFRKKVDLEQLFTLNEHTSAVTRPVLESLSAQKANDGVVWTFNMRRMAVLTAKSLEFNEPVLLVGPTGCGKTTMCQILADIAQKRLRILNCHLHTESGDFLGGLRPYRGDDSKGNQLFEWADGPLIESMQEGSIFLADEISLAEDSVLERLNCLLEPERTLLLAEKATTEDISSKSYEITAAAGFQFLATMNPGGDFGKKELSPALRNRFTEIWCRPAQRKDDLVAIAAHSLKKCLKAESDVVERVAKIIIEVSLHLKATVEKLVFSIRDVLAWCNYLGKNVSPSMMTISDGLSLGLHTIFLDALEMLPYEEEDIEKFKKTTLNLLNSKLRPEFGVDNALKATPPEIREKKVFGITPFFIQINPESAVDCPDFHFTAPTTCQNLFRLLSAFSLDKAVLLEGSPGVGKTSLVENLARTIGYNVVRINLCEQTDLADLFGTDLPSEDLTLMGDDKENESPDRKLGAFTWRDGPLLAALKSPNTWILLDELNLAPQSVLEGLNGILDHRGEVFIPELNKTFKLGQRTRIFATQNPLKQGGGRKGLPQSFLNRFTKVYLKKLEHEDLLYILKSKYEDYFTAAQKLFDQDFAEKMVVFSEKLDKGFSKLEYGYKGGPFEANLRDMMRWCEFLIASCPTVPKNREIFEQTLFEKMQLVYINRMRCDIDKKFIQDCFAEAFDYKNIDSLVTNSSVVSVYWTDEALFLNELQIDKIPENVQLFGHNSLNSSPLLLQSQVAMIKDIAECSKQRKPVLLCGPSDCGKTKMVQMYASVTGTEMVTDTIEDSVTGSFQQFDFNRHLEEIDRDVESAINSLILDLVSEITKEKPKDAELRNALLSTLKSWEKYTVISNEKLPLVSENLSQEELNLFTKRMVEFGKLLVSVSNTVTSLSSILDKKAKDLHAKRLLFASVAAEIKHKSTNYARIIRILRDSLRAVSRLQSALEISGSLNTGGRFEWIDSQIVKAVALGGAICLDHVNLCSSAILDRLNPVFEPNGSLLVSEKGVTMDDGKNTSVVQKHSNFEAFLTMDPKNGEISRAMRNRCLELAIISSEFYTEDDFKRLIFRQGVHELCLINKILAIHHRLKAVSDFSTFNVSDLLKFGFLVKCNLDLGGNPKHALSSSAIEVYVRGSNIDLLGFGINFYKNKLRQEIMDELNDFSFQKSYIEYQNLVVSANNLTSAALVRFQFEPLFALIRVATEANLQDTTKQMQDVLVNVSQKHRLVNEHEFNTRDLEMILLVLYQASSVSDLSLRHLYMETFLKEFSGNESLVHQLLELNTKFFDSVKRMSRFCKTPNLPMNPQMIERLSNLMQNDEETAVTIEELLHLDLIFPTIETQSSIKLNQINALTYSKAIKASKVTDMTNHWLIKRLYEFMTDLRNYLGDTIGGFAVDGYLPLELLYIPRLYKKATDSPLFINKRIDQGLLDTLSLHYKWLAKALLDHIKTDTGSPAFHALLKQLEKQFTEELHPIHMLQKVFRANYSHWMPLFTEKQVTAAEQVEKFTKLQKFVPELGHVVEYNAFLQACRATLDHKFRDLRRQWWSNNSDVLAQAELELKTVSSEAADTFMELEYEVPLPMETDSDLRTRNIGDVFQLEMAPILEYFVCHSLVEYYTSENPDACRLNAEYFVETSTLSLRTLNLVKQFLLVNSNEKTSKISKAHLDTYLLESLANRAAICQIQDDVEKYRELEVTWKLFLTGPCLSENLIQLLLGPGGGVRNVGLGQLDRWRRALNDVSGVLWTNANLVSQIDLKSELFFSSQIVKDLLIQFRKIEHLHETTTTKDGNAFFEDLTSLRDLLKSNYVKEERNEDMKFTAKRLYQKSLMITICGAIELHLSLYLPLLDPVEKNRLKTEYCKEDIEYVQRQIFAYEHLSCIMNYPNLFGQSKTKLNEKLTELRSKLTELSKKVALRPVDKPNQSYTNLVQELNHFLTSCCAPKMLQELIEDIIECHMNMQTTKTKEVQQRINLFLANVSQFVHQFNTRFGVYYKDFVMPVIYSTNHLRIGFSALHDYLRIRVQEMRHLSTGLTYNINEGDSLQHLTSKLVQFPHTAPLQLTGSKGVVTLLTDLDHNDAILCKLVQANVLEIRNSVVIAGEVDLETFTKLKDVLELGCKMWEKQEQMKKQKKEEEDSLYVTKTHCEDEPEEAVAEREIAEIFPTFNEEDFADFIQRDTLEKITKVDTKKIKNVVETLGPAETKLLAETFIILMTRFVQTWYYNPKKHFTEIYEEKDYLKPFELKLSVFAKVFGHYKDCMRAQMDDQTYPTFMMGVGLARSKYGEDSLANAEKKFDFYTDSNVSEIVECNKLLNKIEKRVTVLQEQWPENAVLNDIIVVIDRFRNIPCISPIVRFSTGLQILRQKLDEWNSVAHKGNNMRDLEHDLADYVHRWMRMELQHWRECLSKALEKAQTPTYSFFIMFMGITIDTFFSEDIDTENAKFGTSEELDSLLMTVDTHFTNTFKHFEKLLQKFMESSSYAQFSLRLELLKAMELYVTHQVVENPERKERFMSILYNTHAYYRQFEAAVKQKLEDIRRPIEKKIKDYVKIESFNKDLSYFSMKHNISRVHRNLHKFIKEYESGIKVCVGELFAYKESGPAAPAKVKEIRSTPPYSLPVLAFISPITQQEPTSERSAQLENTQNDPVKLFTRSKTIVKKTVASTNYTMLLLNVEDSIADQIDTATHLRKLEVNRNQERKQQKSEAKHILNQKRRALTEFFKFLTNLGVNHRSGIHRLQVGTTSDLINYQLLPFTFENLQKNVSHDQVDASIVTLGDNLESKYFTCVFKLRLLLKAMQSPAEDLGPVNLERIRGYSTELFTQVQNQRKYLAKRAYEIHKLREIFKYCENLQKTDKPRRETDVKWEDSRKGLVQLIQFVEQLLLLLKVAPNDVAPHHSAFIDDLFVYKTSSSYPTIIKILHEVLAKCQQLLADRPNDIDDQIKQLNMKFQHKEIENLFCKLNIKVPSDCFFDSNSDSDDSSFILETPHINKDLTDLIFSMLVPIQDLHIKYKVPPSNEEENMINENCLTDKLQAELRADLKSLKPKRVLAKLNEILEKVDDRYASRTETVGRVLEILPIFDQYLRFYEFFFLQLLATHKLSVRLLHGMLTTFLELTAKGFCVPPDLLSDEEPDQQEKGDGQQNAGGFSMDNGEGEKDASDKIESEDQLEDAQNPNDKNDDQNDKECKEEKGIDMSEDFDAKAQDIDKNPDDSSDDNQSEASDLDKEMGDTEQGAEKLDDQIWGSDEEENPEDEEEQEKPEEEHGKGSDEQDDTHNDLSADNKQNEEKSGDDQDGLDAAENSNQKQKEKPDIDQMNEDGEEEDQVNPNHNELEEPPKPDDLELDDKMNLDGEENPKDQEPEQENPFDIDKMKEQQINEDGEEGEESEGDDESKDDTNKDDEKREQDSKEDSQDQEGDDLKEEENSDTEEAAPENDEAATQVPENEPENKENDENKEQDSKKPEDYRESRDKQSKEDNVQAMPEQKNKGSTDQVQVDQPTDTRKQENEIDEQDTGEDKDGIGQAENEDSKAGHKGVAQAKKSETQDQEKTREEEQQEQRKKGESDERRTLDNKQSERKKLKTVEQMNDQNEGEEEEEDLGKNDADEYQHIKEAKGTDKSTLDTATEEQSKQVQHEEDAKMDEDPVEGQENSDELPKEEPIDEPESLEETEKVKSEQMKQKKDKSKHNKDTSEEKLETQDPEVTVEGEQIDTLTVPRGTDTTSHISMDIVRDATSAEEPSTFETLELRRMFEQQLRATQTAPEQMHHELWQQIANKMLPISRELCEQLRLILEPTKRTRFKGDYRTGRRINMKKIIPYIASQFRKDKIWLRRTKPAQRDYKITIAVDDSKSMDHNNSKSLTLEAISLVSQALTLLESGNLNVISFGERPQILLDHSEQFEGAKLIKSLNFDQNQSKIAELLDFTRIENQEGGVKGGDNNLFENLLLILSDGRNIFAEGEEKVRNAIKLARLQRIFIVYIIIDNPENKHSILDIRIPKFSEDRKTITMHNYLDLFPFPYYIICRDLNQLPFVLSDAMRQWFELVNSDQ